MTYEEAVEYLNRLKAGPVKLGLERVRRHLSLLGDPQEALFTIHVAGTNGKGSVAAMISSIIRESGLRAGLFISPHLHDLRERIMINFSPISQGDFARLVEEIAPAAREAAGKEGNHPTYFEFITALAVKHFADEKVDAAVFEVGLGGRLDATNVLRSRVQVITNIGMDHVSLLGSSIEDIAREKADIIEEGGRVVAAEGPDAALEIIAETCSSRRARLYRVGRDIRYSISSFGIEGQVADIETWRGAYPGLKIALPGDYQAANAALAVGAAECIRQEGMNIDDESVRGGLMKVRWPGRFEVFGKDPVFVLDGAHNPPGAAALARSLSGYFPRKRIVLILGVLKDKDYRSICRSLVPLAERVLACPVDSGRSLAPDELAGACPEASPLADIFSMENIEAAIGFSRTGSPDVVCVTGSLYLVAQARELLLTLK